MTRHDANVSIESLVLDGLDIVDGARFGGLVSVELTRLLSAGPLPNDLTQSNGVVTVDGGRISVDAHSTETSMAASVAGAIHRGLTR